MSETTPTTTQTTECPEKTEDPVATANTLLATGKRHLLCGEVSNAIESLQESCRLLSEKYGETAQECGEAYFFYGKALLELSRMESGVLGNALDGIPDEEEEAEGEGEETKKEDEQVENPEKLPEDEREEVAEKVMDAMTQIQVKKDAVAEDTEEDTSEETEEEKKEETAEEKKEETTEEKKEETTEEKKEEPMEEKTEEKTETTEEKKDEKKDGETKEEKMETTETATTEKDEEAKEGDEATEEEDDENKENEEKDEDVSNTQLAWEMLDLARVIFLKSDSKEMQLKAAQAYLKLGEVGLELERHEQAIEDFKECLKIQKVHLEASDRLLAETHYQLGVAYSYTKLYKEAREEFTQAMKVIEDKKASLQKVIDENKDKEKKEGEEDPATVVSNAEQEMTDLNEILPDIQAKIKDTEEEEQQLKQMVMAAGYGAASTSAEAKPIGVKKTEEKVNVLVPRKRKAEEETPEAENETKKTKQENGSGDAPVNGTTNGTEEVATNGTNGTHKENGDATEMDTSEPAKIVTKTVEDVKKQAEGETEAAK